MFHNQTVGNIPINKFVLRCSDTTFIFRFDNNNFYIFHAALACYGLLCILISLANVVVIYVITMFKTEFSDPVYSLYIYTAFTDLLLGIIATPLWIATSVMAYQKVKSCILFEILIFSTFTSGYSSYLLVFLLAVDRYIAICKPFFYIRKIKPSMYIYRIAAGVVFLISIAITFISRTTKKILFKTMVEIFKTVFVFLGSCFIYIIIYHKVRKMNTDLQKRLGVKHSDPKLKNEQKLALSTFLLLFFLYLCYLPHTIKNVLEVIGILHGDNIYTVGLWTFLLMLSKSFFNPLLYCLPLKIIRKKIQMVFKCSRGRKVRKVDSERTTKVTEDISLHTGFNVNVHRTLTRCPRDLLNDRYASNLRPEPRDIFI